MTLDPRDRESDQALVVGAAERLNRGCFCLSLDRPALMAALDAEAGLTGFAAELATSHASLFSNVPVFVDADSIDAMTAVVSAVEAAARLPDYVAAAMRWAPAIARADPGPIGAMMGYDFHLTPAGPKLIEVNTNAGGAFLNAVLAKAQRACCVDRGILVDTGTAKADFGQRIAAMFVSEWQRQRGSGAPMTIAIVDDDPSTQFLLPEFTLAKALLEQHGLATIVVDAAALDFDGTSLSADGRRIDLVYNRLVDFALAEERHDALRAAYVAGLVVVTPNPHAHALFADKRNLSLLSDPARLAQWGLAATHVDVLRAAVPPTVLVTAANADALWEQRRQLFFKPAGGHGSRAAYRGEKLTRKVWADILAGDYVAQAFAAPGVRMIARDGVPTELKIDVRLFTFEGVVLLAVARLYQGQTTNMRTPGGGFAPLFALPPAGNDPVSQRCCDADGKSC